MNTDVMFSSKSDDWETPPEFFRQLDDIFHFTIDLAANKENALCKRFYTYEDNQGNPNYQEEIGWLNPPYGREIKKFMQRCCEAGYIASIPWALDPCNLSLIHI